MNLNDEIGYLTKAAFLAGHSIDFPSSWRAGYPALLVPAFFFFDKPSNVWTCVQVINAFLYSGTFLGLLVLVSRLFYTKRFWLLITSCLAALLFPTAVVMSSYAYASTAMIFFFAWSAALLALGLERNRFLLLHAACVGYMYWIHPSALAIAVSSIFVLTLLGKRTVDRAIVIACLMIVAAFIIGYSSFLQPTIDSAMTAEGQTLTNHYDKHLEDLEEIFTFDFFSSFPVRAFGVLGAALISTFGTAFYSAERLFEHGVSSDPKSLRVGHLNVNPVLAYLATSFFGVVFVTVFSGATYLGATLSANWLLIHNRYVDPTLVPLIAIGLLSSWRSITFFFAVFTILIGACLFMYSVPQPPNLSNEINLTSFWPRALDQASSLSGYFVIGALGVSAVGLLGKRWGILVAAPLITLSIVRGSAYHAGPLSVPGFITPSSVLQFVEGNFSAGTCIGFDSRPSPEKGVFELRRNLYSFYFMNFDFKRTTYQSWLNSCEGVFLTQHRVEDFFEGTSIVARNYQDNLRVVVRSNEIDSLDLDLLDPYEFFIDPSGQAACLNGACTTSAAHELARYSNTGALVEDALTSNGDRGFLFYGPYVELQAGSYDVYIVHSAPNPKGAVIEVVSQMGSRVHVREEFLPVSGKGGEKVRKMTFQLENQVKDLEIRLWVTEETLVAVRRLVLTSVSGAQGRSEGE